jgi:flagellar biosynthesis protein FlhF
MTALPRRTESATLLAFPRARAALPAEIGAALRFHRLPEMLAAGLVRDAAGWPGYQSHEALACAIAARSGQAPLDLQKARAILLLGPAGSGKSAVAAKIIHAAGLAGRKAICLAAEKPCPHGGSSTLTVMEAAGFNPLNGRAASAFAAVAGRPGVETFGVISALTDAADAADIVAALKLRRVIVTGLDRTRRLGALVAAITGGARLAHVTRGSCPEDALEMLEPGALAALLLESAAH